MVTEEISRQASDSVLKPLAALVTRKQAVTVASNLANAGVLTKSRIFPYGAPVTLKVKPAKGKTFRYWAGSKGDSLTGALRYTFTMDSLAHSYTAVFVGGTTGIAAERPTKNVSVLQQGMQLRVSCPERLRSVRISNASGRVLLERKVDGNLLLVPLGRIPSQELLVRAQTEEGSVSQTIRWLR